MKKVFLAVLVAGLFVACGNKNTEAEATDSTAVEVEEVVEEVVEAPATEEVAEVTTEEAAAPAATPAKESKIKVDANEDGAKVKIGDKAEISVQPKQTKGSNF